MYGDKQQRFCPVQHFTFGYSRKCKRDLCEITIIIQPNYNNTHYITIH